MYDAFHLLTSSAGLEKYSEELGQKERWLVLNKLDLIPEEEREERCQAIVDGLQWSGPVYRVAAINGDGTHELMCHIMEKIEKEKREEKEQREHGSE